MKVYEKQYLKRAAQMVGDGDVGLLNYNLVDYLNHINSMAICGTEAEEGLVSRQAIAVAIQNWLMHHPNEKAYED